jgi:hypothetical protein
MPVSQQRFELESRLSRQWHMSLLSMYGCVLAVRVSFVLANDGQAFILAESGYDCQCAKPHDLQGNCANMAEWTKCYNGPSSTRKFVSQSPLTCHRQMSSSISLLRRLRSAPSRASSSVALRISLLASRKPPLKGLSTRPSSS